MANKTAEEIQKIAIELSDKNKTEVSAFSFIHNGKQIIGYLKQPERATQMQALSTMFMGDRIGAGQIILRTSLLPESSEEILSSDKSNDTCFLTGCVEAAKLVDFYTNDLKKNTSE